MQGPLATYPYIVFRLACRLCKRQGSYRLARLAAKFGAEAEVDDVVVRLSADCEWRTDKRNRLKRSCGAFLPDLEDRPPPDVPPHPRHRLRLIK